MSQHVDQHFGIRIGVDVAVVCAEQLCFQGVRVGEIAVVRHHQTKRSVDVKRLGLLFAVGVASRGVAHLPQAHITWQGAHISGTKYIAHHALCLVHEKLLTLLCHYACGVLAAVLQQQQAVVYQLINRSVTDHANNATHLWNQPFNRLWQHRLK